MFASHTSLRGSQMVASCSLGITAKAQSPRPNRIGAGPSSRDSRRKETVSSLEHFEGKKGSLPCPKISPGDHLTAKAFAGVTGS